MRIRLIGRVEFTTDDYKKKAVISPAAGKTAFAGNVQVADELIGATAPSKLSETIKRYLEALTMDLMTKIPNEAFERAMEDLGGST